MLEKIVLALLTVGFFYWAFFVNPARDTVTDYPFFTVMLYAAIAILYWVITRLALPSIRPK